MFGAIKYYARLFGAALWWAFWPSLKIGTALGSGVWFVLGVFLTREFAKQWGWFEVTLSNTAYEPALIALGAFFFLFVIRLLAAPYVLWNRERKRADETAVLLDHERQKFDRSLPKFRGKIEQTIIGENDDGSCVTIMINMSVRNTGSPSIAEFMRVFVEIDGQTFTARRIAFPDDGITLHNAEGGVPSIMLRRTDAIYDKGASPIGTGSQIRGWLPALLSDCARNEVTKDGTKITVEFRDVEDKIYSAFHIFSGQKQGQAKYYPDGSGGINQISR
jgi:hypothetical protein